mmetsp:Transcript_44615/g.108145  ORF Transcript_44615/g.108145 Transcript_44615/m.108145 type:complete len:648 (+) Transcript_44615:214-2157(+)
MPAAGIIDGNRIDVDRIQRSMVDIHSSGENRSYEWRKKQLQNLQLMLTENQSIFQQAISNDLGRDRTEAIVAEIQPIQSEIKYFLQNLKRLMEPQTVDYPAALFPCRATLENVPLPTPGVLIIGPSNYPLNLVLRPLAGVLAGGNPCVIKPSELTPCTSEALASLVPNYFAPPSSSEAAATETGASPSSLPPAVQIVLGGPDATSTLLERPWGKVLFTGSERVGKIVAKKCAETLTPVCLELGGKCYCIIDESIIAGDGGSSKASSSLMSNAADRIVFSKCFNAGQTCVAPDTFVVHESLVEQFALALQNSLQQQFGIIVNKNSSSNINKNSSNNSSEKEEAMTGAKTECRKGGELPRIVTKANAQRQIDLIREVEERIKSSSSKSTSKTKIVVGGSDQCDVDEKYIVPTVVIDPPLDSRMIQEEIFGPIFPIVTYKTREEAIDIVNNNVVGRKTNNDDNDSNKKKTVVSSYSDSIMQRLKKQHQPQIPLYLYVFCTDDNVFRSYIDSCPSAGAVRNDAVIQLSNHNLPFGGAGTSGYGEYFGKFSYETFTNRYPVTDRPLGSVFDLNNLRCHPYKGRKGKFLEKYLLHLPFLPTIVRSHLWVAAAGGCFAVALVAGSSVMIHGETTRHARNSAASVLENVASILRQ